MQSKIFPDFDTVCKAFEDARKIKNHPHLNSWGIIWSTKKQNMESDVHCFWFDTREAMISFIENYFRYFFLTLEKGDTISEIDVLVRTDKLTDAYIEDYKTENISEEDFAEILNSNDGCDIFIDALGHFTNHFINGNFDFLQDVIYQYKQEYKTDTIVHDKFLVYFKKNVIN